MFDAMTLAESRCRLRFALLGIEQGWSPVCDDRNVGSGEWGVLKLGCVNGGRFRDEHKALSADLSPRPELEVRVGDVLMSRANTRDLVGSCAVVRQVGPKLMLSDLLYRLKINTGSWDAEYVALALGSQRVREEIKASAAGSSSSMPKLNHGLVKDLTLPHIALDEQRHLVARIADERRVPDQLVTEYRDLGNVLMSYREALVAEAVTGQLNLAKVD
ncbi:MAG: hypothetical protein JWR63_1260, partial [Conexibacter sp.]|nr:hypothetical protein [Conexibacter sp.]